MKIKGLNITGLDFALHVSSLYFDGNLKFQRLEKRPNYYLVRINTKSKDRPGCLLDENGRKRAACFHAHSKFIETIFEINPSAKVTSILGTLTNENSFDLKQTPSFMKNRSCTCKK